MDFWLHDIRRKIYKLVIQTSVNHISNPWKIDCKRIGTYARRNQNAAGAFWKPNHHFLDPIRDRSALLDRAVLEGKLQMALWGTTGSSEFASLDFALGAWDGRHPKCWSMQLSPSSVRARRPAPMHHPSPTTSVSHSYAVPRRLAPPLMNLRSTLHRTLGQLQIALQGPHL